tara:strand:- start:1470 stop:2234 length:765 start_codon:yes stop_codon:yes gene_type:complete
MMNSFVGETTMTLENTVEKFDGVQDPARSELFLVKDLDPETSPVLYYKYESMDPMRTDTAHDHNKIWREQTTDVPSIIVGGEEYPALLKAPDGREVNIDDGFIMDFHGRPTRTVAQDQNRVVLDEAQARAREQAGGSRLRRFTEWGFKLARVTLTDGPAQRFQLMESEKKQRDKAETSMATRLEDVFAALVNKIEGGKLGTAPTKVGPSSASELMDAFDNLTNDPLQAAALKEHLLGELESKAPASAQEENSGE